jgi:hypothetical protein
MKKAMIPGLALIAGLFFTFRVCAQTPVFINEIHYDNAGTDAGEGVEVAGPAGTVLTGWKILFYNGNGGVLYDSVGLSGAIPGRQNGFGTLWTDAPGSIQNGPDGLAMVNADGYVIQFLSYEGSFTATDGPASGLTSMDIGVEESGVTGLGQSLQLSGEGSVYEDFSWSANLPATPDAANASQTLGATSPADTVPPAFTSGYPRAANITQHRFDILLNLSEACTVYYIARMSPAPAPDSLEVQCGDTLMVAYPGMDYTLHIDTASPSSSYEIYFLAADHATPPNVMDTAVMLLVRTTDDINLKLVRPLSMDTVYIGDSVMVSWTSADIDSIQISLFDFKAGDWTDISGGGIPAEDSTWGFHIPVDAGLDSIILSIASTKDPGLHLESGVICLVDTIVPKLTGLFPANHATGVPLLPSLKMEFDERVYAGTGNIGIYGEFGGLFENLDVTGDHIKYDPATYSVHIMLPSSLPLSGRYYVLVDPGAFRDYQGNAFGGFSSVTDWSFTTTLTTGGHLACWENPSESRIRIYPNPAEERITLEWYGTRPGNLDIEIIGMKGITVYRNAYRSIVKLQENIGLQDLASGIYMLKIRTEEGISVTWLVVQ